MSVAKPSRAAAALGVLVLLGLAGCSSQAGLVARRSSEPGAVAVAPADTSPVLVRIGGQAITADAVRRRLEEIPESARGNFKTPEGRQQLLDRMVEERVWYERALELGVADRPSVQQTLAQQRRDLLIRTHLNEVMAANPAPSDSEARVFYEAHLAEFRTPSSVTMSHIQTKTREQARQVLKLARAGQDWARLARKYSTDSLTRASGGNLGTSSRDGAFGSLGRQPALAESAMALGAGKIGGPYRTDRGWHVVKVEDVRPESVRPYDSVRPVIMRQLAGPRSQEFYRQRLEEARLALGVTSDSAAIRDFLQQRRDARQMFKDAQELGPALQRIEAYRGLLREYPDADVSPQAQFMIGFIYSEELKDYDEAEKAFRELLTRYPGSELTNSAQWMVEHMRSEEAPPFDLSEADSSLVSPRPQGTTKGSAEKP